MMLAYCLTHKTEYMNFHQMVNGTYDFTRHNYFCFASGKLFC